MEEFNHPRLNSQWWARDQQSGALVCRHDPFRIKITTCSLECQLEVFIIDVAGVDRGIWSLLGRQCVPSR